MILLKNMQPRRAGKKNEELFNELVGINGIGEERARVLIRVFKTREQISAASFSELDALLPSDAARKVKRHFR